MTTGRFGPYAFLDVLAVIALSMLALAGFAPTFSGEGWLLVSTIGVLVGVGWPVLLVRFGLGMDLAIESLPVPYLFTAGGVALGSSGLLLGIPDATTLGNVVSGTVSAWRRLAETAPPADSAGVLMLVPYALAIAFAGSATAMSVRSRRPALPLLPLLMLLGAVLVLGVQRPASVLLQGVAFGALALLWVGHRGGRVEAGRDADLDSAVVHVPTDRVAATVAVVAVAAACVTPLVGIGSEQDRWVLRESLKPYDAASVHTPLSSFRRFREGAPASLAREQLFTVRGVPRGTVVRIAVLDRYDGDRWYATNDRSPTDYRDRFLRVASTVDNPGPGEAELATIRMKHTWDLDWLPVVGRVQGFEFYDDLSLRRRDAIRFNRSTGTAILPGGVSKGEAYILETLLTRERLSREMKPWPEVDRSLADAAAFLDLPARVWSTGAKSPMDAVFRIAERLRTRGRYSDGAAGWETRFLPGHGRERLDEGFVNAPMQVGNDEQYAATMALLANRVGVPARVVVGASVGRRNRVRGKAIGAWVEVRIANGTWRTLPTSTFMSRRPPRPGQAPLPPVQMPPRTDPQQAPQQPQQQQPEPPQPPQEKADEREALDPAGVPLWGWALAALLLLGVIPTLKLLRRLRRRSAEPPSKSLAGAWEELLDRARDLGLGWTPGSRPQQADALALPLPLARAADVATFAPEPLGLEAAEAFWDAVDDEVASLRGRVPGWRRLLAVVSPASLLPRGR